MSDFYGEINALLSSAFARCQMLEGVARHDVARVENAIWLAVNTLGSVVPAVDEPQVVVEAHETPALEESAAVVVEKPKPRARVKKSNESE